MLPSPTSTLEATTPEPPAQPTDALNAPDAPAQPTEPPPGRLIASEPSGVDVIWWDSNDDIRNHIGDSFLYAGFSENSALLSAVRFDLSRVPRGAPILSADLELVGLRDDRLNPESGGSWSAQILAQNALPDYRAADYQAISTAPAAASLLPTLFPADLSAGASNIWRLDPSTLDWIEQQLLNGSTELWVRLTGPTGGDDTLVRLGQRIWPRHPRGATTVAHLHRPAAGHAAAAAHRADHHRRATCDACRMYTRRPPML